MNNVTKLTATTAIIALALVYQSGVLAAGSDYVHGSHLAVPCDPGHTRVNGKFCKADDPLSDDFSPFFRWMKPLLGWSFLHNEDGEAGEVIANQEAGALYLSLGNYARWWRGEKGGLVYRETMRDFRITALVKARSFDSPFALPSEHTSFVGIMARRPDSSSSDSENYVHLVIGCRPYQTPCEPVIEWKNTVNSESDYQVQPWSGNALRLRICKQGNSIRYLKRESSDNQWVQINNETRNDMDGPMQIGLNIYSHNAGDKPQPDLKGVYSWFEHADPNQPGYGCTQ